ncbi:hypothetical protein [Kineosporia babensis]|uniref:Uncharacterized protein n=1 Tax=Kineosporia babensis TaxID=499548 RepID=A0A9X1ND64_9ACTN|nr:hypothetical protein [Kineosporia babensis]MCD5310863.1 hypothetical protein [Kineosporia babensis]
MDADLPDVRDGSGLPTAGEWLARAQPVVDLEFGSLWELQVSSLRGHPGYRALVRPMPELGLNWSVEGRLSLRDGVEVIEVVLAEVEVWPREWGEPSVDV